LQIGTLIEQQQTSSSIQEFGNVEYWGTDNWVPEVSGFPSHQKTPA